MSGVFETTYQLICRLNGSELESEQQKKVDLSEGQTTKSYGILR